MGTSRLQRRLKDASPRQATAIVGIACRVPGADDPAQFWKLLESGSEAIREAPAGRKNDVRKGWRGGFLDDAFSFDGRFFRLAAQAADLDPRHRMLLEVTWEACENAGQNPLTLPADRTGVFLGISGERHESPRPLAKSPGMAVGYLCQFLDIRGPVLSIDTTCSSSLVALHLATQSLREEECDLAIVGGVNLLSASAELAPDGVVAADGRSRAFDASAAGFGQGEGCVILVLKPLALAVADRDRIYATIIGSAINHDGRSATLTAPNPRSQAAVIRNALSKAGIDADAVQYVEAHGTGTYLGDPIEVEALASAFAGRRGLPLAIGSVKTNIGHLEAAAGAAGVMKAALSIAHSRLVPSLHCANPNPCIPWGSIPIRVQTGLSSWPQPDGERIAGVSSFGMSGTNAHVILAEAPGADTAETNGRDDDAVEEVWLLPLSAKSEQSLRASARRWAKALAEADMTCRDVSYTATCRRPHLARRIALAGSNRAQWIERLNSVAEGRADLPTQAAGSRPGLVMVFGGQGSQWAGMGRELFDTEPVFRQALLRCANLIEAHVTWSLEAEMQRDEASSRLGFTQVTQPALFAIQFALSELWKSWGILPDAVMGHSLGEITAAHVAGVITLEQAAWLVCERGRIMSGAADAGAMMHVRLTEPEAAVLVRGARGRIEIAAVNGPDSTVLSGDRSAIRELCEELGTRGVRARVLAVDRAFHSAHMDDASLTLAETMAGMTCVDPRTPIVSTLTAELSPRMDAMYWSRQLRERVRFMDATRTLLHEGYSVFLEVGPNPILQLDLQQTATACDSTIVTLASMRRGRADRQVLTEALGALHCAAVEIDWSKRYGRAGRLVDLPTYAWDHVPYESTRVQVAASSPAPGRGTNVIEHVRALVARHCELGEGGLPGDVPLSRLGIDSLDVLRIRSRIAAELDVELPAGVLGSDPTLDELVSQVLDRSGPHRPASPAGGVRRVVLKPLGAAPAHTWVHPVGGGVSCYRPLVQRLPFIAAALEATGPVAGGGESVQDVAARYLSLLDTSTPFVLAGWSFGGLIAYEMAIHLQQRGIPTPLVVLVDSYVARVPAESMPQPLDTAALAERALQELDGNLELSASDAAHLRATLQSNLAVAHRYRPGTYDGPVLLVLASRHEGESEAVWRTVARNIHVVTVEGDHYSILRPPALESVASLLHEHVGPLVHRDSSMRDSADLPSHR